MALCVWSSLNTFDSCILYLFFLLKRVLFTFGTNKTLSLVEDIFNIQVHWCQFWNPKTRLSNDWIVIVLIIENDYDYCVQGTFLSNGFQK